MKECSWKNLGQMKIMRGNDKERLLGALRMTYTELIPARCTVYELQDGYYLVFNSWKFLKKLYDIDWWVAISPTDEILGVKVDNEPLSWRLQYFHPTFLIGNHATGELIKFSTDPTCSFWIYNVIAAG